MQTPALAAIVLAAGKGTRMKSALPKVLHAAAGKPLLAWSVETALAVGAQPVVAIVGHGRAAVEQDLAARFGGRVAVAVQAEQKGTGHAVQMALPALAGHSGAVVILYGDCPLLTAQSVAALAALRERTGAPLALLTTHLPDATGYGRIVRGADGLLARIVEHKDASAEERAILEVNPGVYCADVAFLRTAVMGLSSNNAQGELYLTDIVAAARALGHGVPTLAVQAEETLGVNDRVQLGQASDVLRHRIVQEAQRGGVTFLNPGSTWVDASVTFGTDVTVGPHVSLHGTTHLEEGCTVGAGAVLTNTRVRKGAAVHAYSVCDGAEVGPGAIVGPHARLRPGAVLEEGAHVGNFVELKQTRLGKGAKANHLAYLGDADIGAGSNIGAGTITCNYDGVGKHKTAIGTAVFVGSNSTLVAPLNVGADTYIAAGSVVTEDIPAGALAFGRARQVNKPGLAEVVRKRNQQRAGKPST